MRCRTMIQRVADVATWCSCHGWSRRSPRMRPNRSDSSFSQKFVGPRQTTGLHCGLLRIVHLHGGFARRAASYFHLGSNENVGVRVSCWIFTWDAALNSQGLLPFSLLESLEQPVCRPRTSVFPCAWSCPTASMISSSSHVSHMFSFTQGIRSQTRRNTAP